ncbi:hypothetical protein PSEUBRA_004580 [Kalmanozyma brasiliensis GHG001]|uniref:Uncharacterized protein n=1 Tax=Kalmanozyma brasiliensis (strain GHG001) TaxID=1365824 RepID=V5E8M6_KALBG|nr:uncharacterized protein PSEUBRA_004580 [Kalmanozyma brasiliensis GHG001]EST06666.1 hypothetical protein PSEUBRA_004580 [Kalmanozyma brasiliensis GHG001]
MQAEPSHTPHAGLAASGVVPGPSNQITSPYLAAAPAGLFASPSQSALFDPSNQTQSQHPQHQQPQSAFAHPSGSFQHPAASPQDAVYRVPAVPRSAHLVDYSNSYPQLDSHMQPQQPPHSVPYNQHLYASTSYSALAGPNPVAGFAPELSPHAYTHSDLAMMQQSNMGVPMMRYGSFAMAGDDMSRASSSGTPGPMTQQDIDNLLAMSRAQAGTFGDVTAFPCTYCDKVYTGKHARSIWRRHLQDKHNIPLSAQPRRTRWDGDVNRPKNAEERRARMLESKRRWARKKRLQEKQAAMGGTPLPDDSDDEGGDDGDDSADADVSSMSMSFSRSTNGDDSLSMPQGQAEANRRASMTAQWEVSPHAQFFASQDGSGRPVKRQALGPSTAHNVSGPSSMPMQYPMQPQAAPFGAQEMGPGGLPYSSSPMRRGGLPLASMPQQGTNLAIPSNANASFSSNSSDYSQPGSASFFNDSFAGNISSAGSDTANTSIDAPATTWPALPPLDGPTDKAAIAQTVEGVASADAQPRAPKGDTRDAAIQLLALRSGSNSPADDREMSLKRRDAIEDAPWSSTPSRGKVASAHAALNALSCSSTADGGRKAGALDDLALSPSPVSRALASGANSVRAMPVTTPGPANRAGDNPFSLDKHKISPYEGRRKLSYSGAPASPTTSPTHLTFNASKGVAAAGTASTAALGVKLAPLVSTPIRPSQGAVADEVAERIKAEGLPPLLASTKKTGGAPIMSTPFSKPMSGLGYSALRHGTATAASTAHMANLASAKRPTPSRHRSDDQFSSPQHLNLTESLGLAPHSISRTSSYAGYGSSLGLTPSVAHMTGGLISGTPFHSGLGALSGLGGFTPLSTAKGAGFWPESSRKSGLLSAGVVGNSPTVYKSSQTSVRSGGASRPKSRTASPALGGKGDIFDADYRKEGPSSDDTFDDDDDENAIGALDTPSRPAAMRGLARTKSAKEQQMGSTAKRSPLRGIRVNQ